MEFTDAAEALCVLETALAAAQKLLGEEIWRAGDSEVVECLRRVHRLTGQVQGLQVGLVREVEQRGMPAAVGAVDSRAWLRSVLTMSPGEAKTTARMAEALAEQRKDTSAALAAGHVNWEQARAIVEVVGRLARTATIEQQTQVETFLLDRAEVELGGHAPVGEGPGPLPGPRRSGTDRGEGQGQTRRPSVAQR